MMGYRYISAVLEPFWSVDLFIAIRLKIYGAYSQEETRLMKRRRL
jgi:hypothetical protein